MPLPTSAIEEEEDLSMFFNTAPPPPYGEHDLTPTPHSLNRPRLPQEKRNPYLALLPEEANIVKFQTIVRENKEIIVGRIKVPTVNLTNTPGPQAHAFILRRYDTNAISLTTMYRVAFPGSTDEEEKREMDWVKSCYDTRNTNGGRGTDLVRLAGLWVSRHLAIHLAPAYGMQKLIDALARAVPDPNVQYRKSIRSQQAEAERVNIATAASQTVAQPTTVSSPLVESPSSGVKRRRRSGVSVATLCEMLDGVDDTRHLTIEARTELTAPAIPRADMEAEIAAAKQLVKDLKRELKLRSAAGEDLEDQGGAEEGIEGSRGVKRGQAVANEAVVITEGAGSVDGKTKRVIVKNRRVEQGGMVQGAKKMAWSAFIFGLGFGAATLIPQVAPSFF